MKNKTHLFYGIIIGILLCACVGGSIDDQKEFKEIHRAYWDYDEEAFRATVLLKGSNFNTAWNPGKTLVPSPQGSPDDLREAGWTIIDMELHSSNIPHYLVGK